MKKRSFVNEMKDLKEMKNKVLVEIDGYFIKITILLELSIYTVLLYEKKTIPKQRIHGLFDLYTMYGRSLFCLVISILFYLLLKVVKYGVRGHYHAHYDVTRKSDYPNSTCCHFNMLLSPYCRLCR